MEGGDQQEATSNWQAEPARRSKNNQTARQSQAGGGQKEQPARHISQKEKRPAMNAHEPAKQQREKTSKRDQQARASKPSKQDQTGTRRLTSKKQQGAISQRGQPTGPARGGLASRASKKDQQEGPEKQDLATKPSKAKPSRGGGKKDQPDTPARRRKASNECP